MTILLAYLFYGIPFDNANLELLIYILSSRYQRLLALLLTAFCGALATLIFQTITSNRILTPSLIGLDNLYILIQTLLVFFIGSSRMLQFNSSLHYFLSLGIMFCFAIFLFKILFQKRGYSIYFILLIGFIMNSLFQSLTSFFQLLIDPNEFFILQARLFTSFNAINPNLLIWSFIIVGLMIAIMRHDLAYLDILLLEKDRTISLGVDYNRYILRLFILVSILVAVSTALVGPITFFGLLVVSLTYKLFPTYKHHILLPASSLIAMITLIGGQLLTQNILHFEVPFNVLLNVLGGTYFIYIVIKKGNNL